MIDKFLLEFNEHPELGLLSVVLIPVAVFFLIRMALRRTQRWLAVAPTGMRVRQWFRERPETFALVIGVLCLLVAAAALTKTVRLLSEGRSAVGEVISLVETSATDHSTNRTVKRKTATIRFQDGRRVEHFRRSWEEDGSICIAGCYYLGERLKILYLPQDPEAAVEDSLFGIFGPLVIVGLVGTMFLVAWWIARAHRRASDPRISGPAVL